MGSEMCIRDSITAESVVGKGSVFTVVIPVTHVSEVSEVPSRLISQEDINIELAATDSFIEADLSLLPPDAASSGEDKPRLLVIDDNPDIRNLVGEILGEEYEIHQAADGREGLAKAARLVPDIIICDIMMPVMDGLEATRRIRSMNRRDAMTIPIVAMSANAFQEDVEKSLAAGLNEHLTKPLDEKKLTETMKKYLGNKMR